MEKEKKLIWVEAELAEKYEQMQGKKENDAMRVKMIDEYIDKLSEKTKKAFAEDLATMEEEAAIYTGLMLKVKQAFGKALDEALSASYSLWENFDKERPVVNKKIAVIVDELKPLKAQLDEINGLVGKINTFDIDRLIDAISKINGLYGESKDMVEFLVKNYTAKQ